jgi:adenylate cyclase
MLDLASEEPSLTQSERHRRRERRSAWLRLPVLLILAVNLVAATDRDELPVHAKVVAGYGIATVLALVRASALRGPRWMAATFVVTDAVLVVVMFHAHLFAPTSSGLDHRLTAPTLAIGFVLLAHVALRLQPRLVLLFSVLVISGWMALLAVAAGNHANAQDGWEDFAGESALAATFVFAALVCWLLTKDHAVLLSGAVSGERKRRNLARFFSPTVLSELQSTGTP